MCLWSWLMADFSKSKRLGGVQGPQDSGVDPHPLKMSRPAGWYRTYVGAPVGGWGISGCFAPTLVCKTFSCVPAKGFACSA